MKRLTPALRSELHQPFARPVSTAKAVARVRQALAKGVSVVAVGDAVCAVLARAKLHANLSVFDFVSQRRRTKPQQQTLITKRAPGRMLKSYNPAGYLSYAMTHAVTSAVSVLKRHPRMHLKILVDGEEDLAVLPALANAKAGSLVLYGQPHEGVVMVNATPAWKKKTQKWLGQFKRAP